MDGFVGLRYWPKSNESTDLKPLKALWLGACSSTHSALVTHLPRLEVLAAYFCQKGGGADWDTVDMDDDGVSVVRRRANPPPATCGLVGGEEFRGLDEAGGSNRPPGGAS